MASANGGYLLSYFTSDSESLHLATSRDGHRFSPLGDAVLTSSVGSTQLRDPFIGVGPDGRHHLLATDGWRSADILHAVSDDLLDWSEPELLPVMRDVPGTVNAWAPEFFLDGAGTAHLIWSSVVDDAVVSTGAWNDPEAPQRIWSTSTSDFINFAPSHVFFAPGYSVIDATVVAISSGYLMAFKDERGRNEVGTEFKCIRLARFDTPGAPIEISGVLPASPVEGPSLFRRDDEWVVIFDHFLENRYGAVSTTDGITWVPFELEVPDGMRHGSVLQIDDIDRLTSAPQGDRHQAHPAARV